MKKLRDSTHDSFKLAMKLFGGMSDEQRYAFRQVMENVYGGKSYSGRYQCPRCNFIGTHHVCVSLKCSNCNLPGSSQEFHFVGRDEG